MRSCFLPPGAGWLNSHQPQPGPCMIGAGAKLLVSPDHAGARPGSPRVWHLIPGWDLGRVSGWWHWAPSWQQPCLSNLPLPAQPYQHGLRLLQWIPKPMTEQQRTGGTARASPTLSAVAAMCVPVCVCVCTDMCLCVYVHVHTHVYCHLPQISIALSQIFCTSPFYKLMVCE